MKIRSERRWYLMAGGMIALAMLISQATGLLAQQTLPDEVRVSGGPYFPPAASGSAITVKTQLVEVGVVVRDARGHPIAGLTQSDFKIFDNGKERAISAFTVQTFKPPVAAGERQAAAASSAKSDEQPSSPGNSPSVDTLARRTRYVALYFDDEHTQPGDLGRAQTAAERFVREALAPEDRVAIFTSSSNVSLDFTNDVAKIVVAIESLKAHVRISENGFAACPRITPYQAFLIANGLDPSAFAAARAEAVKCNCTDEANFDSNCAKSQDQVVRTQADQTWGQARIISENTLATIRGVVNYLAKAPGDRMLLLASSGFLAGTTELEEEQDKIVAEALRAGVVINALDAKGLYAEPPGRPFDSGPQDILPGVTFLFELRSLGDRLVTTTAAMANFAASTGGIFFHNRNDLDSGMREIGMVPEVSYLLGFTPSDVPANGKYHKLKVVVGSGKHEFVQARPGYFAPTKEAIETKRKTAAEQSSPMTALDREVFGSDTTSALAASTANETFRNGDVEESLRVTIHLDVKGLTFEHRGDRSVQKLTMVAALFDNAGNFVTGERGEMDLALTQATVSRMDATGINPQLMLRAPAGSYRLRAVAQEGIDGKIFASSQQIEIR